MILVGAFFKMSVNDKRGGFEVLTAVVNEEFCLQECSA
jgi:hypothetical protein